MAEEAIVIVRVIPFAAVLAGLGCNPSDPAVDPAPPLVRADELARAAPNAFGGGPRAETLRATAIERVAKARCEKLETCPNVLSDPFKSADVCIGRETARAASMWSNEECGRVDPNAVESCVSAAAAERCDASRDSLYVPLIGACAPTSVCPPSQ